MQEKARQESARIGTYEEIETEQLLPPPTEGGEPTRGALCELPFLTGGKGRKKYISSMYTNALLKA